MIEDVFVGAPSRLVQGRIDVKIMIPRIKGRPSQIVEKVVVRLVASRQILRVPNGSRGSMTSEIRQEIHGHVGDVSEEENKSQIDIHTYS